MRIIKNIPNTITCLNLFSGCIGVWLAFQGNFIGATIAIALSALFDFLDGMVARAINAYSEIGKELDSLADAISFGLVPGVIVFSMLSQQHTTPPYYAFVGFIIPVFSALRLAKFNVDTRQTKSFIGLPTPANAIFWAGISVSAAEWFMENQIVLIVATLISSYIMVAEIPMFSLKFKNLSWKDNKLQFIFLAICVVLIVTLKTDSIAPIILWYILLSVTMLFIPKK